MKATMQLMNGRSFIVDRIFKMDRVGKHTYEFTYWADGPDKNFPIHGKIRVTEVVSISINDTCECHSVAESVIDPNDELLGELVEKQRENLKILFNQG